MLPAWLGAGTALQKVVEDGKQSELEAMCRDWPFFSTRLGMLEMVFAKADLWLAEYYDQRLVDKALWPLGKELRNLQEEDIKVVLAIANDSHLMADLPWIAESIQLRNIYTDPLNVLQAELLHRSRQAEKEGQEPDPRVEQALMVTIAGIAVCVIPANLPLLQTLVLLREGFLKYFCSNTLVFNIFLSAFHSNSEYTFRYP